MIQAPFLLSPGYLPKTILGIGLPLSALIGVFAAMGETVQLELVKNLPAILMAGAAFVSAVVAALAALIQMVRGIKSAVVNLTTKTDTLTSKADTLTAKAKANQDAIASVAEKAEAHAEKIEEVRRDVNSLNSASVKATEVLNQQRLDAETERIREKSRAESATAALAATMVNQDKLLALTKEYERLLANAGVKLAEQSAKTDAAALALSTSPGSVAAAGSSVPAPAPTVIVNTAPAPVEIMNPKPVPVQVINEDSVPVEIVSPDPVKVEETDSKGKDEPEKKRSHHKRGG